MYEENWPAVQFFCRVQTQWIWISGGMAEAKRAGLNYASIKARRPRLPKKEREALWVALHTMELSILKRLNE